MQPLSGSAGSNTSSLWGLSASLPAGQFQQQWQPQQSEQLPPKPQQQQQPQQQQHQHQHQQQESLAPQLRLQAEGPGHNQTGSTEDESRFADLLSFVDD